MNIEAVRRVLSTRINGGPAAEWARNNGLSAAYVSDVLNGRRDPGDKILKALGLECVKDYRKVKA